MINNVREGIIFVLSGPSGGGKTTLAQRALERHSNLSFSVSYTTRIPREGEVDGKDYRFVSETEFGRMVKDNYFVEYAKVHNNYYGTPLEQFGMAKSTGIDLLLDIDVQGARQIRKNYSLAVLCFILPSSFEILRERLVERGSDNDAEINRRLSKVRQEMRDVHKYDYIIVNDDLDKTADTLSSIIVSARCEANRVSDIVWRKFFGEASKP